MRNDTAEFLLAQIMDWVYEQSDSEDYTLHFGIWDSGESPYSMYATLHKRPDMFSEGKHDLLVAGESSYGSDTAEEALNWLLRELAEKTQEPVAA